MYYEMDGQQALKANGKCLICGAPAFQKPIFDSNLPNSLSDQFVCGVCGRYRLSPRVKPHLDQWRKDGDNRLYKLSYASRTISNRAQGTQYIEFLPIDSESDTEKILDRRAPSVQEKLNLLLRYLAKLSPFPGAQQRFDGANDYSMFCAQNANEANFYMKALRDQGFLDGSLNVTDYGTTFSLTAKGWMELDRLEQSGAESSHAFVAMWFDSSRLPYFEAMKKAVGDAGYLPIRIDFLEHLNPIEDEIIAQIRQSKFLVADLTGQRNGVYFEAGFMLGLGRPVIWACEKESLGEVHFDARQFNTIDYTDAEDLRTRLQFRIEAVLGKGPIPAKPTTAS